MGTPDFAVESLKSLQQAGNNILAVVTNIDNLEEGEIKYWEHL